MAIVPHAIYTVPEAAALLDCTTSALRALCRRHRVICFRAGYGPSAPFRIRGTALLDYLAHRPPVSPQAGHTRPAVSKVGRPKHPPRTASEVQAFPDHADPAAVARAFGLEASAPARTWQQLPAEQFAAKVNEWLRQA